MVNGQEERPKNQTKWISNSNLENIMKFYWDLMRASAKVQYVENTFTLSNYYDIEVPLMVTRCNGEAQLLPEWHKTSSFIIYLNSAFITHNLSEGRSMGNSGLKDHLQLYSV